MAKCKKCNADIVFLKTNSGKLIPVNFSSLSAKEILSNKEITFDHNIHITHFSDCPFAYEFRKKKK